MMTDKVLGNNQVNVYGEVISDFTFSHEVYGEGFYTLQLSVRRLSNVFDTIPLMVSERLIDVKQDYRGKFIEASGQFRSYNRHEENHNRLVLSMFVTSAWTTSRENVKNQIIFSWTDISARCRYIVRHHWDARLQTYCLR